MLPTSCCPGILPRLLYRELPPAVAARCVAVSARLAPRLVPTVPSSPATLPANGAKAALVPDNIPVPAPPNTLAAPETPVPILLPAVPLAAAPAAPSPAPNPAPAPEARPAIRDLLKLLPTAILVPKAVRAPAPIMIGAASPPVAIVARPPTIAGSQSLMKLASGNPVSGFIVSDPPCATASFCSAPISPGDICISPVSPFLPWDCMCAAK